MIEGRLSTVSAKDELVKLATQRSWRKRAGGRGRRRGRSEITTNTVQGQGHGYRNGISHGTAGRRRLRKTTEYSAPQIAGRDEPFRSAIADISKKVIRRDWRIWRSRCWRVGYRYAISKMPSKTRMVACCYRKPPCRNETVWEDYQAFAQRDLALVLKITYLFVDGIASGCAAWRQTRTGSSDVGLYDPRRRVLPAHDELKEDAETVTAFFEDMKRRGLKDPPGDLGRCSGHHQGDRNLLSTRGPPAVPCASHAGLAANCRRMSGRIPGSRAGSLSSAKPSHCASSRPGSLPIMATKYDLRLPFLHGRLRSLHRAPAIPGHPPPRDRDRSA